jgi:hypothetical protein
VRLLGMLIEVGAFHEVVEPSLGLPASLVLCLLSDSDLVFINDGEGQREVLFRVSVEVASILADLLSHLVLLELPNILSLRSVHVYFEALGNVQTLLERSTSAHALDLSLVLPRVVNRVNFLSFPQEFDKLVVSTVGISLAFADSDGFFLLRFLFFFSGLHDGSGHHGGASTHFRLHLGPGHSAATIGVAHVGTSLCSGSVGLGVSSSLSTAFPLFKSIKIFKVKGVSVLPLESQKHLRSGE